MSRFLRCLSALYAGVCWSALAASPAIVGGEYFALALTPSGTLYAWGDNRNLALGQSGVGSICERYGSESYYCSPSPLTLSSLSTVTAIGAGQTFAAALKSDGTVWVWGGNDFKQLATATGTAATPQAVAGLSGVSRLAVGRRFALALKSNGTVMAWGDNTSGQLGRGGDSAAELPAQVTNLSGAVAVAAGGYHSLALKSDGSVVAWGLNSNGQLGTGNEVNFPSPQATKLPLGMTALAAGDKFSLALRDDGTVWAWGYNADGQLGNGSTSSYYISTPAQISGLTEVVAITAGEYHALALKRDGSVWGWGSNGYGQLGRSTPTSSATPLQITGFTGSVVAIGSGLNSSYVITSDGAVWSWGNNALGQLGLGVYGLQSGQSFSVKTPTQVVGSGGSGKLALGSSSSPSRGADCLFEWAQTTYPSLFVNAGSSASAAGYYYRYYAGSGAYLGVASNDSGLYYLGPASANTLLSLGRIGAWLAAAGCRP